jgi:hypothetical protein
MEPTHAGPKDAVREAELQRPSGVVCSDFVRPLARLHFTFVLGRIASAKSFRVKIPSDVLA